MGNIKTNNKIPDASAQQGVRLGIKLVQTQLIISWPTLLIFSKTFMESDEQSRALTVCPGTLLTFHSVHYFQNVSLS